MACAWGGVAGYGTAMLLSYFVGQHKCPIDYEVKRMLLYVLLTGILYYAMSVNLLGETPVMQIIVNTLFIVIYLAAVVKFDLPLKSLLRR